MVEKDNSVMSLEQVYEDSNKQLETINLLLSMPSKLILVSGPESSGKTTTLYAMLNALKSQERRGIVSIESTIEQKLDGVNQIEIGSSYPIPLVDVLKSYLRTDPDVVAVDYGAHDLDLDTANLMINAALMGHLVISTFYTEGSSINAIERVLGLKEKEDSHLIAAALLGITNQRLVRKLCGDCKEEYRPTQEELRSVGLGLDSGTFYIPKGCETCQTGYAGITAVHEVLAIDRAARYAIASNTIEAIKPGKTLFQNGLEKAMAGTITLGDAAYLKPS